MTGCAGGELHSSNPKAGVALQYGGCLVIVAGVACILCIGPGMAGCAGRIRLLAVIQWKCMHMQERRKPGLIRVAILALASKETHMYFRLCMAGTTLGRRSTESLILVAVAAVELSMPTC